MSLVCNASIPVLFHTPPLVAAQRGSQVARFWIDPPTPVPKPCSWKLHSLSTSSSHPDDAPTTWSARTFVGGIQRRGVKCQSFCRTSSRVHPCPSIPSSDGTALQPRIRLWTPPSAVHSLVRLRRPSSGWQPALRRKPIEVANSEHELL